MILVIYLRKLGLELLMKSNCSLISEPYRTVTSSESNKLNPCRQGSRRNSDTNGHTDKHSLADSSITRSIRKVYQPPPLLLKAVHSDADAQSYGKSVPKDAESCGRVVGRNAGINRKNGQTNKISRNYRGGDSSISRLLGVYYYFSLNVVACILFFGYLSVKISST